MVMVGSANFCLQFGNHGEGQSVPSFRRTHRDGCETIFHGGFFSGQKSNSLKLSAIGSKTFDKG